MTLIRRPVPFPELLTFRDTMDRWFDDRFFRPMWPFEPERGTVPVLDLYTTPEAVVAKVALPGVKPENVDVTIGEELVTISGTFEEEQEIEEAAYVRRELKRGSFTRSFPLPTAIKSDAATAVFKDGLLTLTLPRTEAAKPMHVKVTAT
jgi:HSP20 family protein